MDISFIIPIYNTEEKILLRCFESILKLEKINYEVVLIDDGSESFVEKFCIKFCEKYKMFHYYKKCNEGVSAARNFGIYKSIGEYIFFIDSDDVIIPEDLSLVLKENSSDVIIYDIALVNESKALVWKSFDGISRSIQSKDAIISMMYSGKLNSPFAKFIKRSLILENKINFNINLVTGEDADFILNIFMLSPSIYYINKVIYQYWRTEESSRRRMLNNATKIIDNYEYHAIKKIKILQKIKSESSIIDNAKISVITTEIKNLFNLALDLQKEKMLKNKLKDKIIQKIENIDLEIISKCNKLTKLRYSLLKNRMWNIMRFISYIRNLYLLVRGLHL